MKTSLFYFSGTGNSLQVARDMAAELGDTELVSIPKAIRGDIDLKADSIGIVFPVYGWKMPKMVEEFIDRLEPVENKYYFAVCTYGAMLAGALKQTAK